MTGPTPACEPIFNIPWPVRALALAIVAAYTAQRVIGDETWAAWGLIPPALFAGRWELLFTSLFVHGGWAHALGNALGVVIFGPPVAKLLGLRPSGGVAFFAFFLLCGVIAGLGNALLHPQDLVSNMGASGAAAGLMGATSRLVAGRGQLGPVWSRTSVTMAVVWTVMNLLIGLSQSGRAPRDGDIAWEAHLIGYFAGLLLIGVLARTLGRYDSQNVDL